MFNKKAYNVKKHDRAKNEFKRVASDSVGTNIDLSCLFILELYANGRL
ncbi:hypothetical protein GCM10025882_30840 [Acinetobacter gyllenbergii]|nr:hypothetical protein GCM10025882_30840 [Acinetobacter gyllenbergii]